MKHRGTFFVTCLVFHSLPFCSAFLSCRIVFICLFVFYCIVISKTFVGFRVPLFVPVIAFFIPLDSSHRIARPVLL
ncbi:hypothetical protein L210DRAFT_3123869 [Boletus edulis BED1]|uniref:Uncharacterized protein n=1 Tax=Boletus edulis BED1 TaxID=1328754 RepID=A0AAD4BGD3_BOLED|nr:hypothetical protein L210DRAFT_3123869 [Boletus edulis BED1]